MNFGVLLTLWTIRLAVGCYVLRLFLDAGTRQPARRDQLARWIWSAACGLYLMHVVAAFHYIHGWSHARAFEQTARQTAEVTGLDWGGGIYFNYLFTLLWLGDVAVWWRNQAWHLAARRWRSFVQATFAFMMVNATAVFGPSFWKWLAGGVCVVRFFLLVRRKQTGETWN